MSASRITKSGSINVSISFEAGTKDLTMAQIKSFIEQAIIGATGDTKVVVGAYGVLVTQEVVDRVSPEPALGPVATTK